MQIYYGKGTGVDREELVDFLNLVFGFNGYDNGFMHFLPCLYKEQYDPAGHNLVAMEEENGRRKLRAAVGVYPRTFSVMGETFLSHGIGNVAVHPDSRGKGYMRQLMHMAIDDMIEAGADFSDLGGLRHRYRYYGYEKAGCEWSFAVTRTNLRHVFPDAAAPAVYFKRVTEGDSALLDAMHGLYESKAFHTVRPREALADILNVSGHVYSVHQKSDDGFCGFFRGDLEDLVLADEGLFLDTVRAYLENHEEVELTVQPYETARMEALHPVYESCHPHTALQILVFRFRRLVAALLRLKAQSAGLVDGVRAYQITGIPAGKGAVREEAFTVSVSGGVPEVHEGAFGGAKLCALSYLDAVSFFFGLLSPQRHMDPVSAQWFPLAIHIDGCDHV